MSISVDTLLWIIGAGMIPVLGWGIHITWILQKTREDTKELTEGLPKQTKVIEDNTRAMKSLTHYIQWLGRQQTGIKPPPPLDD